MLEQTSKIEEKKPTEQQIVTASGILLKATLLSLGFAFVLLSITALGVAGFIYYKVHTFATQAQTTVPELKTLAQDALATQPEATDGYKTILLLGIDSVSNKPNSPELTDTIVLLSINMNSGRIGMLSLPRDLWSSAYQTRINALYEYGKTRYPDKPEQFPQEVISELTGIPIQHTITLSLGTVAEIIDTLNGIEVSVTHGFTDDQFPREDVDVVTVKNPADLYETVTFEQGMQHMDGQTALKYIRSRKSADIEQGTDIARSERQQQVISALFNRVASFSLLSETKTLANLYTLYNKTFEAQLSKKEALATLNHLLQYKDALVLESVTPSIYPESEAGVITNPPLYKYKGQWVYEIREIENFKKEVADFLKN